ncbi:MAG: hypothetical protein U1F47_03250 [Hyphomicrobiales bacterium]
MIRTLAASAVVLLLSAASTEASVRNFFAPEWNGSRLAACLTGGQGCGKPAADAFCQAQGYDQAVLFQREHSPVAMSMGNGEICEGGQCTAFRQIKCQSVKDDLATLQQVRD